MDNQSTNYEAFIPPPPSVGGAGVLRLGAVDSAYSQPLLRGLNSEGVVVRHVADTASLTRLLLQGELDCALAPLLVHSELPHSRVVPGLAVCTEAGSGTTFLLSRVPLEDVRRVGYAKGFAEGAALAKVLLGEHFGLSCELDAVTALSDAEDVDAVLYDRTMAGSVKEPEGFEFRFDLSSACGALTGFPCVHLVWVARPGAPLPRIRKVVWQASREEPADLGDLVEGKPRPYFTTGPDEVESMREWVRLAAAYGLCDAESRLTFC